MTPVPPPPRRRILPFVLVLTLWTVGLLLPPSASEAATEGIGDRETLFYLSKFIHVGGYAAVAWLGGLAVATRRGALWLLLLLSAHAFTTEFLQQFVERGSSLRDVGLDHAGLALGVALSVRWWRVLASARGGGGRLAAR